MSNFHGTLKYYHYFSFLKSDNLLAITNNTTEQRTAPW